MGRQWGSGQHVKVVFLRNHVQVPLYIASNFQLLQSDRLAMYCSDHQSNLTSEFK